MKQIFIMLLTIFPLLVKAQDFVTVKENLITSVKDQYRSGTCWDFATLAFIESEILRISGKTYDLCEMFVANKDYIDVATHHVRMHGYSQICEGGAADDVFEVIKNYGICPQEAMPKPGSLVGAKGADFEEFMKVLKPKVKYYGVGGVTDCDADSYDARAKAEPILGWKDSVQNIIDKYIGKCPESFDYQGKTYTPKTFAASLGIDWNNYISLTSFTHHPFYENFVIEAMHKWRPKPSFNLPIDNLMQILDRALEKGFCVCWGGDVTGNFSNYGIAKLPENVVVSQEMRQKQWDNWTFTYDHVMLIFGIAKDKNGKKYYKVKNSWGEDYGYKGIWYMSEDFIKLNTTYLYLCKDAVKKKDLREKK
ncbi:MAG: aminopeptidase [Bacteroidales bacterium]|nr:aminopeptidase [Bacteroidales bacterium]